MVTRMRVHKLVKAVHTESAAAHSIEAAVAAVATKRMDGAGLSVWTPRRKFKVRLAGKIVLALQVLRPLDDFASFVPKLLHQQLLDHSTPHGVGLRFVGDGRCVEAAALFSDASGFTALTEKLAQQANGAEKMCKIMNGFLTIMISIIDSFGGDVIKFAGDALLVVFPVDSSGEERPGTFPSVQSATLKATACACRLNQVLHEYEAFNDGHKVYHLSLHIGVGCGTLTALHLGGVYNRWEFVLAGPPIAQVATAEPLAVSGQTCVSPQAWEHVSHAASGHPAPDDSTGSFIIIDELRQADVPLLAAPPLCVNRELAQLMKRYVPDSVAPKIEAGVIPKEGQMAEIREVSVLFINCHGIDLAAAADDDCTAATRVGITVMQEIQKLVARWEGAVNKMLVDDKGTVIICALGLPPRPHSDDAYRAVALALDIHRRLQAARGDHRGSESGAAGHLETTETTTCSAERTACSSCEPSALRRTAHSSEPSGARQTGVDVGCSTTIGVASGHAFCGVVGSSTRREYTMMGDVVNLSARLMGHASKHGLRVLTCSTTMKMTSGLVEYQTLEPQFMKGKADKVCMYEPLRLVKKKLGPAAVMNEGRSKELEQLRTTLAMLHTFRAGGTILMIGERGSGKNYMVSKLRADARNAGMEVLQGTSEIGGDNGATDERSGLRDYMCYTPWNSVMEHVIARLLAVDARRLTVRRREDKVLMECLTRQLKKSDPPKLHLAAWAAELNHVVGREVFKWSDAYKPPAGAKRSQVCAELAVALILELAEFEHLLAILYLHTGTSSSLPGFAHSSVAGIVQCSWEIASLLARETHQRRPPQHTLLLCVVSRSAMFLHPLQEIEEVVALATKKFPPLTESRVIKLEPLDQERRRQYVSDLLRVKYQFDGGPHDVPERLYTYVSDVAAGIPKHIDEVVKALKEAGELEVVAREASEGGQRVLRVGQASALYKVAVPKKMIASARQSFEALDHRQQMVVKYLSPMPAFSVGMIRGLLPESVASSASVLSVDLQDLVGHRVIDELPAVPPLVEEFDPSAKVAYEFCNKLMQHEVMHMLLEEQREAVHNHLELLRTSVATARERELLLRGSDELSQSTRSPSGSSRRHSLGRMNWTALLAALHEHRAEWGSRPASRPDESVLLEDSMHNARDTGPFASIVGTLEAMPAASGCCGCLGLRRQRPEPPPQRTPPPSADAPPRSAPSPLRRRLRTVRFASGSLSHYLAPTSSRPQRMLAEPELHAVAHPAGRHQPKPEPPGGSGAGRGFE